MSNKLRLLVILLATVLPNYSRAQSTSEIELPTNIKSVLETHCLNCHNGELAEGNIRLDWFGTQELADPLELMNQVQEQVYFRHMPPEGETTKCFATGR